ncbi:MAG TPA: hypothetical protein VNY52_06930 [Solirubrobacteraceae bacterium]|jgi:hypothetical protein|nr:hypothetical protein [Solirubrobacteraceae bacterium]
MRGKLAVLKLAVGFALAWVVVVVVGVAPAFAEGEAPWWHVVATVAPTELPPGGTAKIMVAATNLGDGEANGAGVPITVSDRLPPGIVAIGIASQAGPLGFSGHGECSLEAVSCTFGQGIAPYEGVELELTVRVAAGAQSGAVNEAVVEGGGATHAAFRQPVAVGEAATLFGVELFEEAPEGVGGVPDTQAGSHPFQLTTTLDLNQHLEEGSAQTPALAKDLRFYLPAGLVGNPNAVPQCTTGEFSREACPGDTALGVADTTVLIPGLLPQAVTVPVPLFNLVPQTGEPARFGFMAFTVPVILDTSVRTGGDYGVVVTVHNISQSADFIADQVTFWGSPGDPRHNDARGWNCLAGGFFGKGPCEPLSESSHQPFLTLPTSCTTPWAPTIAADSWAEPAVQETRGYSLHDQYGHPLGLSGCNRLTFEPSILVAPDGQAGSTPTGLTVGIHVPQTAGLNPTGDAQATVKNTTVALPAGVSLNPAAADGLQSCSMGQVGLESAGPITCPEASKVGTVEIHTPLLPDPLTGAAYLAAQDANPFGSLVALYLVAEDAKAGVLVKLAGEVKPDPVTGQLVSTFKETPQLPFEDLSLHFFGGSRAPLGTPALCGGYTTTASIEPWSGTEPVDSSSGFQIASGPNGAPCSSPLPFAPALTGGTTSIQAGGFSPFTLTMSREDGQQNLQSIQLKMPPGLLGTLSTVKLCGEPQADAGTCGPESLIGHTIVSVGLGGNPYSVTGGEVFITGPYRGAPYGLSIVNPAKAGPFDLGKVIVRAKIEVDPTTAQLTITTDPSGPYAVPHILDGIPLEIKHINVSIDRPDFTFNPTNCSPLAITGSLGSSEGSSSALSVPFQITNCAVLAFKPKLTASTSGKASRLDGASLTVKLGYPAGPYDANIARVKVELPKALPSRLPTLQKACTAATFEANPADCPAASIIGHATASTPVIPIPLTGPAYFVSHGGEAFPSLVIVLQGYGARVDLVGSTFISKAGVTSSTFKTIPDVPVGTFELTLPQGPFSALAANVNLCRSSLAMPTEFVGQNGVVLQQSTKIAVTGCAKTKKTTHKKKGNAGKRGRGRGRKASGHGRGQRPSTGGGARSGRRKG